MISSKSGSGKVARFAAPRALGKFLSGVAAATFLIASVARAAWALPIIPLQVSTNPGNGDQNPYGVVFVPAGFPDNTVQLGDVLVANFNDAANDQGQGTTIINVRPDRTKARFAKIPTPGLTGAMGILRAGFVLIGSITVPKISNFPAAVGGPITVLDYNGTVVTTITSPLLKGPWGMAIDDDGATAKVFVSNVLNGTVIRLNLTLTPAFHVDSITKIAQGYGFVNNNTFPLVGPSGLAYNEAFHTLYVTSAHASKIFAIAHADTITTVGGIGTQIYADAKHLHGPLGLAMAPNGDLISAQADNFNVNPKFPSEIVEFTKTGQFVAQFSIDAANGAAFNIALDVNSDPLVPIKFAYLNDGENTVNLIYLPTWGLW